MAVPVPVYRIDFNADGDFSDTNEDVTSRVLDCKWTRGRSADFKTEAVGAATLTLSNDDGFLTPSNMLPGLPVHIYGTYSGTDRARFYGFVQRWSPDAKNNTVKVTCYDPLRRMAETDVSVISTGARSARELRLQVLEDFERGTRNLVTNPSFLTDTAAWSTTAYGGTLTRVTGDANSTGTGNANYVATTNTQRVDQRIGLAPKAFAGQVYRFSVDLWTTSGTQNWTIGMATNDVSAYVEKTVSVSTTKQRASITYTMPATVAANAITDPKALTIYIKATGAGTVRFDAAMVTRGQGEHAYSDTGTGRWPSWVANGSFDVGANGWYDAWTNLVANPSFETNTTGWTNVTRITTAPLYGTAHGSIVGGTTATYTLPGTYLSGVTYDLKASFRTASSTSSVAGTSFIGSNGTPADRVTVGSSYNLNTGYLTPTLVWTPSANRSDAVLSFAIPGGPDVYIDGVQVTRRGGAGVAPQYSNTGPGGGGTSVTSAQSSTTQARHGGKSLAVVTPATATAGQVYDFNDSGGVFPSARTFTLSLSIYPTSSMPYKIGLGSNALDGTWDEASTTGTATANTWNDLTLSWTPSADRTSLNPLQAVAYVWQTDATARTFYVDDVRVIPESSADSFEMSQWDLAGGAEASDQYSSTASLTGNALSALSTLNSLTGTRHFIRPLMASPWYEYVTIDRDTFATLTSQETFTDATSDVNGYDLVGFDIDRDQILNIIPIVYLNGIEYYSDATSVDAYGPRPSAQLGDALFFGGRQIPDDMGPTLLARYKDPHARPVMTVERRFPSQLVRELGEVITVTTGRLGIAATTKYVILREDTEIKASGQTWVTKWALEAYPY